MTIRLRDLTKHQVRMLAVLDDQFRYKDPVGTPVADLKDWQSTVADELVDLGLAELNSEPAAGDDEAGWVRLTARGRKVRDVGAA